MSIPTAVFLDTSVFDGQAYNFSSTAFSTFVPACIVRDVKLLLPDPTEREIRRHMYDKGHEALALLEKARRTAPFLANWRGMLTRKGESSTLRRTGEVAVAAHAEWSAFLKQFDVVRLNYDRIRLQQVMDWYDAVEPPFDDKKRKEFPDAFAIAILSAYAEQHGCFIAVVSQDPDMQKACNRFPSLMYFQSLPALTELLLSAENSRIDALKTVLDGCAKEIADAAIGATTDLSFYYSGDYSEIEDNDVTDLTLRDTRIVGLGEHECTIAFDATIDVTHKVVWHEPTPDGDYERRSENVNKEYEVSGTAKVALDPRTDTFVGVPYVALNEEELEATDLPPYWGRWR